MYAGKNTPVPVPATGHVHITKNGYVYWEDDGHWDRERGYTMDSRKSIGKLVGSDRKLMYPNKTYEELFGDAKAPGDVSSVLTYGPFVALKRAAELCGCMEALDQAFPGDKDAIFALAMHAICAETSVAQDFPYWAWLHYCGLPRPFSSEEISDIYGRITEDPDRIAAFLRTCREAYLRLIPGPRIRCVAFDSTSQSTTSGGNLLAAHGHARQNRGKPQADTGLFADEFTGIPVFYEHFVGSILDKSQTPFTVEKAEALGYQKLFVAMDNGYFAQQTAVALSEFEFSITVPDGAAIVRKLIDGHGRELLFNEKHYVPDEDIYGMRFRNEDVLNGRYDAYLYYDPGRAHAEREDIHEKLRVMRTEALKRVRFTRKLEKMYSPWLLIEKSDTKDAGGRNFTIRENAAKVQPEINDAGYFVVVSNGGLDAGDMIRIVRARDTSEKVFQRMKSHFGLTSPYTHNLRTYEGKMLVTFVALVIVQSYRWFLRGLLGDTTSATVRTTLGELQRYQIMRKPDGSWMPCCAMTRKQKDIGAALGLAPDDIQKSVRALSNRV